MSAKTLAALWPLQLAYDRHGRENNAALTKDLTNAAQRTGCLVTAAPLLALTVPADGLAAPPLLLMLLLLI